ncbi:hypothetical protein [Streptomyces antibioticus]|uniref:hypothetical protein n=1 Tax=Streptomyces antibioticus TaxID=1890 RepID=UPI0036DDC298
MARDPAAALSPLRDLLKEDADWDLLLHDITERSAARGEELSEFDASFTHVPPDMAVSVLEPKMSVVAHRAPSGTWDPQAAIGRYGEDRVLGQTVATGADGRIAWFVVEHRTLVDWGAPQVEHGGQDSVGGGQLVPSSCAASADAAQPPGR